MNGFLKRKQKWIRIVAGVLIYCMAGFPVLTSTGWSAPAQAPETVEMAAKEKQNLVRQGVEQFKQGKLDQARKNLEQARRVYPENYAAPYYLGLIHLEQGKRSAAIAQWRQYVRMDPKSENALRIRKNLTLLLREEARDSARLAVANEAALIRSPAAENTVAISAFNNLGSDNIKPLGKGMAALLIHDISRFPDLQVVERVRLQALLKEMKLGTSGLVAADTAPRVGKLLKARHVTSGSLADLEKESLQIASALVDTDQAARVRSQEAQGQLKKFYELEKDIACQIVKDLGRSCDDAPPAFYKTHTKSLAALTAFSVGLNYLDEENYDQARASFQSAVEEDPSFELAQQSLLDTPVPGMQFGGTGMGTTEEMIAMADARGLSADAAGTAIAGGSGAAAGGVGVLPAVGLIGGAGALAVVAANTGDGDGGSPASGDSGSDTPSGIECGQLVSRDGSFEDITIEMGTSVGSFTIEFNTRPYPNTMRDVITVTQGPIGGGELICRAPLDGSGCADQGAVGCILNPQWETTQIHVRVDAGCDSIEHDPWEFRALCPGP